jgi:hypothetical protein
MCEGIHAIQASAEGSDLRPTQREPTLLLSPYVCGDACARTHPAMERLSSPVDVAEGAG